MPKFGPIKRFKFRSINHRLAAATETVLPSDFVVCSRRVPPGVLVRMSGSSGPVEIKPYSSGPIYLMILGKSCKPNQDYSE